MLIPIFFTFNEAYALPAAVAFDSLLRHASREHSYALHVLHPALSQRAKAELERVVGRYEHTELHFHDTTGLLDNTSAAQGKSHFSPEIYFKLTAASFFPQYERILCSDVDVVFCDDISPAITAFEGEDFYIAGVDTVLPTTRAQLYSAFSTEERYWFDREICAGFLLYNLAAIRRDGLEAKLRQYYLDHYPQLPFPEQDCMAVCCRERVRHLSMHYVVCNNYYSASPLNTPFYSLNTCLPADDKARRSVYAHALAHPIQLHYAGADKPWNSLLVPQQQRWLAALWRSGATPFYLRVLPMLLRLKLRRYSLSRFLEKAKKRLSLLPFGR